MPPDAVLSLVKNDLYQVTAYSLLCSRVAGYRPGGPVYGPRGGVALYGAWRTVAYALSSGFPGSQRLPSAPGVARSSGYRRQT